MLHEIKFRVWWNGQMIYPETKNKPCDWLIDQNGKLQSFPNKLGVVYDPTQYEGAVYMLGTGWRSRWYDLYEGDVVRDDEGCIGLVFWDEELLWSVSYKDQSMALSRYDSGDKNRPYAKSVFQSGQLTSLGNTFQHTDWDNWDLNRLPEQRKDDEEFYKKAFARLLTK